MKNILKNTLIKLLKQQQLSFDTQKIIIEAPKIVEHGDYSTPLCFQLAKQQSQNPKELAETLAKQCISQEFDVSAINGFINFKIKNNSLWDYFQQLDTQAIQIQKGKRYLLEYVSANPTGPLHIGHARWASIGSCLANILRFCGASVDEEFYINDTGEQVNNFNATISAIKENKAIPENGYHGNYMKELAKESTNPLKSNIDNQKANLKRLRTHFKNWYSEQSLHKENKINPIIELLQTKNLTYEKDAALWFKSSEFGDEKDRVLIKKDGQFTYFAVDIAYHNEKAKRSYDTLINIWGADHHGYIARVRAALIALHGNSYKDKNKFTVILGQLVNLKRKGKPIRMSKRSGDMITLSEVMDEIGVDATRYFLAQNHANTHIDFDLELAKEKSNENPVYYIQYAYVRINSILKQISPSKTMDKKHLQLEKKERSLMLHASQFKDHITQAGEQLNPQILCHYLYTLAKKFHTFYESCPIIKASDTQKTQRLLIILKTKEVFDCCLTILGLSTPEKM
ncbi:MAG: arginine--tRNA ligase [bacterium]